MVQIATRRGFLVDKGYDSNGIRGNLVFYGILPLISQVRTARSTSLAVLVEAVITIGSRECSAVAEWQEYHSSLTNRGRNSDGSG